MDNLIDEDQEGYHLFCEGMYEGFHDADQDNPHAIIDWSFNKHYANGYRHGFFTGIMDIEERGDHEPIEMSTGFQRD